jgi:hypothetical protein
MRLDLRQPDPGQTTSGSDGPPSGMARRARDELCTHVPLVASVALFVALLAGLLALGAAGPPHAVAARAARIVPPHAGADVRTAQLRATLPADVFMQAISAHDGQHAWQQLCSATQGKLSPAALATLADSHAVSQGDPQATSTTHQAARLGVDYVGAHKWAAGGQVRVYVVTAHWASGADAGTLYIIRTQASGCVDGIWGG